MSVILGFCNALDERPSHVARNELRIRRVPRRVPRRGLSLLEVVLALAILVAALAVLGELLALGNRHARAAADLSTAQVLCSSKMAEIVAGIVPAAAQSATPCEGDPDWQVAVAVDPSETPGLLVVRVTVSESQPTTHPLDYTLTRWLVDAEYVAEQQAAREAASAPTGSSSATSSNPSSSSSGAGS